MNSLGGRAGVVLAILILAGATPALAAVRLCPDGQRSYFGYCPQDAQSRAATIAPSTLAEAAFNEGYDLLERDRGKEAVELFKVAAARGDAKSAFAIGLIYYGPFSTVTEISVPYLQQAVAKGYGPAEFLLGYLYQQYEPRVLFGPKANPVTGQGARAAGKAMIARAAEKGEVHAQVWLGCQALKPDPVRQPGQRPDVAAALGWLQKAADNGYHLAQHNLGVLYAEGKVVPQDNAKAASYFQQIIDRLPSDERADSLAANNIAFMRRPPGAPAGRPGAGGGPIWTTLRCEAPADRLSDWL